MFIVIMIILLGTCVSVLSTIYYNTLALQKTYGTVNSYYGAYYGAVASIERGLLMSKVKYPTYEGLGGFYGNEVVGAKSNLFDGEFWKLNKGNNSLIWSIKSATKHIQGNIDPKTLRTISFVNYQDFYEEEYTSERYESIYGINDGQSFSGTTTPGGSQIIQPENKSVDFNRFFGMNNKDYIVRGLIQAKRSGNMINTNLKERDNALTGYFEFKKDGTEGYSLNPRPTITGNYSLGQE